MRTLVVPGVGVEVRFDVLPPPPAAAGIVGAVGIVDRPSADGRPLSVTKVGELRELLGPGTEVSMPEAVHALANGASELVVSPVLGGGPARASLNNADGDPAVLLRCRSNGAWGNALQVSVSTLSASVGGAPAAPVRTTLRLLMGGRVVEEFPDLQSAPGLPDDILEALNSRSRYVVAIDPGFANRVPAAGTYTFADPPATPVQAQGSNDVLFTLLPAPGVEGDDLSVALTVANNRVAVRISQQGAEQEAFDDLVMDPDSADYLPTVLLTRSRLVHVRPGSSFANAADRLPQTTPGLQAFSQGTSPDVNAYRTAIDRLADEPRVDLVLACIEPGRGDGDVRQIHEALLAHCVQQADDGAPRLAFGSITAAEADDLDAIRAHAAAVRSRRFVLVAPPHAEGAVAGAVAQLAVHESPTFKGVRLHELEPARYREGQLNRLLGPRDNLFVVQNRVGRGIVALRGLTTSGEQVSVMRVADRAIRETRAIAENFIGELNTADARTALREQLKATFLQMERANMIVPSTNGEDPAFLVDVYSTQQDFARGIVRIDLAVRPVRAIDYVYATLFVRN